MLSYRCAATLAELPEAFDWFVFVISFPLGLS